jgi:ABC-2 type transport system permease protein
MNAQRNIKDFLLVLRMQNRQAWFHKKAAIGMILSWSVRIALTIALYSGIYRITGKNSVNTTTLPVAISSMFFYAIFSGFGCRDISRTINSEYKTGAMEIWINKPVSYFILKAGENIGKNMPVVVGLIFCAIGYWFIKGLPDIDHLALRFAIGMLLLFFGIIIGILMYGLIGYSVIWLQDINAVFLVVDKMVMIFGGIYIPISFFPHIFRLLGESLPTGAALFLSQIFYVDFFANLPRFIITQLIWIVLLLASLYKVDQIAKRHLTVNGG